MKELINQIATDLAIYPYNDENYEEYGNRLIYCALVSWAKVQVLGSSYTEISGIEKEYPYVSQRYISEKLNLVLEGLVSTIPHSKNWFYINNDESNPKELVKYILQRLIFCYQISKTITTSWLTMSPQKIVYFKDYELLLGGTEWNSSRNGACSIGLGVWRKKQLKKDTNYKQVFNIPNCNLKDYCKSLEKDAPWKECELDYDYEYFNAGKGIWHNKAWGKLDKRYIEKGISLIRKKDDTYNKYNYFLLYYNSDIFLISSLDQWYYKEKEISRIMYALDYYRGKPAQFKAKQNSEVVQVHCHSQLPNAENRILLMASWPKRTYNDVYYREIPIHIWSDVKEIFNGLGIEIIFE